MMSALWGGEGGQRHVNSCSEIVCRRLRVSCVCHDDQDHSRNVARSPGDGCKAHGLALPGKLSVCRLINSKRPKKTNKTMLLLSAVSATANSETINLLKHHMGAEGGGGAFCDTGLNYYRDVRSNQAQPLLWSAS